MQSQPTESDVSANIQAEMDQQSISGRELARRLGWAQSKLWKRLNGQVPYRFDDVERIARALDIPLHQLTSPRALAS